ncbi:hypothetical protein Btru_053832 [Bulinus truncatus]|nr:hypothetical protein Btru_053832 [Bulinus truncatus]
MQHQPAFNPDFNCRTACSILAQPTPNWSSAHPFVSPHRKFRGLELKFQDTEVKNYVTDIRPEERSDIKRSMLPGKIFQICGPPMVGKTVLLNQVVSDVQKQIDYNVKFYNIMCKNVTNLKDVLELVLKELNQTKLQAQKTSNTLKAISSVLTQNTLKAISSVLTQSKHLHHVFIFYKCEALRFAGNHRQFLYFVNQIVNLYCSENIKVTVMFTTYALFPYNGQNMELINIGMLNDPIDVLSLLEHFAPDTDGTDYIDTCTIGLSFPEGIIGFLLTFLRNGCTVPSCQIAEWISKDFHFLSSIFRKRIHEVENWLDTGDLHFIRYCHPTISRTFTEETDIEPWDCGSPYPMWNTQFLCKVLTKSEVGMSQVRKRFIFYDHWSSAIRPLMEKAINSPDDGSFSAIYQIGIIAARLLMSNFSDEAKQFYDNLFRITQVLGTRGQLAAVEAYCGHLSASGSDVDWNVAEQRLDSAISVLKLEGPAYFYRWATRRKAIILHRQGKYQAALRTYEAAMASMNQTVRMSHEDNCLKVFEFQEEEEFFTGAIYQTIPLIFTGKTDEALVTLMALLEDVESRTEYHPDYPVLLNNIGLALERGGRDRKEALRWYEKSLQERRHLGKLTPQFLVVSLNNIAMLLNEQEDSASQCRSELYLQEALKIQSGTNWFHNSTALTLCHLSEVKLKKRSYTEAFKYAAEADVILVERNKDWNYRLKVLLQLAHCRVLLGDLHVLQSEHPDKELIKTHSEHIDQGLNGACLKKSAEDYIQEILFVVRCHTGEGFDFHHRFLSACAHGMLLHVGHSAADYDQYKCLFTQHVDRFDLLEKFRNKREQSIFQQKIYSALFAFYEHIQNSRFEHLNVAAMTNIMDSFCRFCHILNKTNSNYVWVKVTHSWETDNKKIK